MKEFYLVPKSVYERIKVNNIGGTSTIPSQKGVTRLKTFITPIPPPPHPPKQKEKRSTKKHIRLKTLSHNIINIQENPNIEGLIQIHFGTNLRENALSLFKIMKNEGSLKWNEKGDLLSPINKYNILDILKDLLKNNVKLTEEQLADYHYLLSITNILPEYIKNRKIIKLIRGGEKKLKGGQDRLRWISY